MKPKNQFGISQLSTLLLQSQLDFLSEGKVWHVKSISSANKGNLILAGLDHLWRRTSTISQPTGLMLELANVCNLDCTCCWTNDLKHLAVGMG